MYSINKTLGQGYSLRVILSSLVVAIIILFYTLTVASYFEPDVYRFEDRNTYHQYFRDQYIINVIVDNAVLNSALIAWIYLSFVHRTKWVVSSIIGALCVVGPVIWGLAVNQIISIFSLPFVVAIYILYKKTALKRVVHIDSNYLTLNYFSALFMVIALISIFISVTGSNINDPFIDILTFLSRFTPLIMVLLIFSVFVRIIFKHVLAIIPSRERSFRFSLKEPFDLPTISMKGRTKLMLVLGCMALSVLMVLIPHIGIHQKVAEDTTLYIDWIEPMKHAEDIYELLQLAFIEINAASSGDRPLSLLILHSLSSIFDAVFAFEIFLPIFLAPILVLVIYFLTKELNDNPVASIFSAFMTAVSFQVMIGMYAGFYATWIALIFGYISLLFSLRYLNKKNSKNLIWLSISMVALLFSHVYSWTLITAFLVILLLVLRWKRMYESKSIGVILILVSAVFAVDLVRSYLIGLASGVERDAIIAASFNFGFSQLSSAWSNIVRTVEVHLGGIFGNIIVLLLSLYYTILVKYKNVSNYFVIVFFSLGILPLLFGDKIVQSRVLYEIPFQIPAALALASIFFTNIGRLFSITVAIGLLAISIYVMSNLGVAPR